MVEEHRQLNQMKNRPAAEKEKPGMMARMQRAAAWVGSKLGVGNETTAEDHAPPEKCEPELGETTSPEEQQVRGCCAEAEMPITNYRFMSEVRQAPEADQVVL